MCVPDLLGTQGTFLLFTTRPASGALQGRRHPRADRRAGRSHRRRSSPGRRTRSSPAIRRSTRRSRSSSIARPARARSRSAGPASTLELGQSERLDAAAVPGRARRHRRRHRALPAARDGRALLALRVAASTSIPSGRRCRSRIPSYYATYLAKRIGPFATLGPGRGHLGAQRRRHDDATFLQQAYDIDDERRSDVLRRARSAARAARWCASSTPPIASSTCSGAISSRAIRRRAADVPDPHEHAIRELYEKNDALVGERPRPPAAERRADGALGSRVQLVPARRQPERVAAARGLSGARGRRRRPAEWLRDVDWVGRGPIAWASAGMFLNVRGREEHGIVAPGAEARGAEGGDHRQAQRAARRRDATRSACARRSTPPRSTAGPYLENAPDLIIGYNAGYRASWDCATGVVAGPVFEDNTKAWSGDHCIDPRLVPGVFFCNRPIDAEAIRRSSTSRRRRCACSGIEPPAYMEGRAVGGGVMTGPARRRLVVLVARSSRWSRACGPRQRRPAGASSCSASTAWTTTSCAI